MRNEHAWVPEAVHDRWHVGEQMASVMTSATIGGPYPQMRRATEPSRVSAEPVRDAEQQGSGATSV
jgi:hypothetical protein